MRKRASIRRRCLRIVIALAMMPVVGWIIESPWRPGFSRPFNMVYHASRGAFVHGSAEAPMLSNDPIGRVGNVYFLHFLESTDDRLLGTQVHEYRGLFVLVNGVEVPEDQMPRWRTLAAAYFRDSDVAGPDRERTYTLYFGYPGNVLDFIVSVIVGLSFIAGLPLLTVLLLIGLLKMIASIERPDPRIVALRNHTCPTCRYDLRGLPECRCPECGDTWLPGQVPEVLL